MKRVMTLLLMMFIIACGTNGNTLLTKGTIPSVSIEQEDINPPDETTEQLQQNSSSVHKNIIDIQWTLGPDLPVFGDGFAFVHLLGQFYLYGGIRFPGGEASDMYVFDGNSWSFVTDFGLPRAYTIGVNRDNKMLVVAGRQAGNGIATLLSIDLQLFTMQTLAPMRDDRFTHTAAIDPITGKIVVAGGTRFRDLASTLIASYEVYNPQSNSWDVQGFMPIRPMSNMTMIVYKSEFYLLGGIFFTEEASFPRFFNREIWKYNPDVDAWSFVTMMPYDVSSAKSVLIGNEVVIMGGHNIEDLNGNIFLNRVMVLNLDTLEFRRMPSNLLEEIGPGGVAYNGTSIYLTGGENVDPSNSNKSNKFQIGTPVFEE